MKAPHASARGIDAHKKIVSKKRHVAVDSNGRLLLGKRKALEELGNADVTVTQLSPVHNC